MRTTARLLLAVAFVPASIAVYAACGDDEEATPPPPPPASSSNEAGAGYRGFEPAGQACTSAAQCYLDPAAADAGDAGAQIPVKGSIYCETKVDNGYCTHECTDDTDCCAATGECRTAVKQVCSPFTNTDNPKYCFLSCEDDDIRKAIAANVDAGGWDGGATDAGGAYDPNAYCQYFASANATCRSSGGGKQNRKICVPQF